MSSSFGAYQRGGSAELTNRWDSTHRLNSANRSILTTTSSTSAIGRPYSNSTSNASRYNSYSNLNRAGSSSLSGSLSKMSNKYTGGNSSFSTSTYEPKRSTYMSNSYHPDVGKSSTNRWNSSTDRLNSGYSRSSTNNLMSTSYSSSATGSRFGLNSMNTSTYSGSSIPNRTNSFKSDLSKSLYESTTSTSTTSSRYNYDSKASTSGYSSFSSSSSTNSVGKNNSFASRFKPSIIANTYSTTAKPSNLFTTKDDPIERTYERIRNRYADKPTSELKSSVNASEEKPSKSFTNHVEKSWSTRMSSNYSTGIERTSSIRSLTNKAIEENKFDQSEKLSNNEKEEVTTKFVFQPKICVESSNVQSAETSEVDQKLQKLNNKTSATLILSQSVKSSGSQSPNSTKTPVLIVTQPTAPSTPMSTTTPNVTWTVQDVDSQNLDNENEEYSTEESYEDEEYSEEESEWEESEGEEVEEFNTSITIPIFTTDQPDNLLHPNHALARSNRSTPSSISSAGEFDTEFDLTLMVKPIEQPKDQRGRTSHVNLLPPAPIFTASVTYDGWEENGEELDDEEQILSNAVFFVNDDNLQVSYPRKLSAYSSGGESEYEGNVEVGCTLSLVDKAALQDSGSEYTTDSDYEDESESYEESEEFEEEYSEEDISEEANIDMNKVTVELNGITTITDNNSNIIDEKLTTILIEPKLEDKSAVRKAPENMSVDEQKRVEQKQKELADQKARSTGLVNSMRNQFRPPSPIKQEPITYKRSTRLEPKPLDEQRERKNYTVVKPVINDEFDKQMAELRAQMEDKNTRLLTDYRNLSKGINSTSDDAKLRAKEDQHRELIDNKAEEERARWHEQNMSSVERKHREDEERERKRQLELKALADEKAAAQLAAQAAERKVTKRVMRKPADIKQETNVTSAVKKAEPIKQTIDRLNKKSATPEKKILAPTENTLVPPTQTQANGERRKSIPSSRRKTMELMVRTLDGGEKDENANVKVKKSRKRKHQIYRKNKFVRKPFDIDDLLGFSAFKDFEELDNYFRDSSSGMRKPVAKLDDQKRRRMEPQKIWISQLKDIDKLYKSSELRDIKLDGVS